MKKFRVKAFETRSQIFYVEAEHAEQALDKANDIYWDEERDFDPEFSDIEEVAFSVCP